MDLNININELQRLLLVGYNSINDDFSLMDLELKFIKKCNDLFEEKEEKITEAFYKLIIKYKTKILKLKMEYFITDDKIITFLYRTQLVLYIQMLWLHILIKQIIRKTNYNEKNSRTIRV